MEQEGVHDPDEPVEIVVTRSQAWAIYDLLIAEAVRREGAEFQILNGLGSDRYRRAANDLRAVLDRGGA